MARTPRTLLSEDGNLRLRTQLASPNQSHLLNSKNQWVAATQHTTLNNLKTSETIAVPQTEVQQESSMQLQPIKTVVANSYSKARIRASTGATRVNSNSICKRNQAGTQLGARKILVQWKVFPKIHNKVTSDQHHPSTTLQSNCRRSHRTRATTIGHLAWATAAMAGRMMDPQITNVHHPQWHLWFNKILQSQTTQRCETKLPWRLLMDTVSSRELWLNHLTIHRLNRSS